ncbi:MAG: RidA family protein [Deltaproteobacteria bacterium]|nr:RidA family protein [Deltaproteobacteria bacterium]
MDPIPITVTERRGRLHASSGAPWEPVVGYSRGVRAGRAVAVTGTVGRRSDGRYPPTAEAQTRRALEIIRATLEALGARLEDVVRTRIFVTDIGQWEAIGRVHGEVFGHVLPCTTMVEVSRLIDPEALVEIEADALVEE